MKLTFKRIIVHNFLSYAHSEIDLENRGYCLVSGTNKCPKDNAVSNGSGKSSWMSAICFALTGETCQGVKTNIKNIYVDEDDCYVDLFVDVDDKRFEIKRIHKPKSDLKIYVNGEDKSGKGIRESELVLASYLPDLNRDTLMSVVLLGQGLPNKLSSFSPSGRKEIIEKLSKSDFMIEDIKQRIESRKETLNKDIRSIEDNKVKLTSTLDMLNKNVASVEDKLSKLDYKVLEDEYKQLEQDIHNSSDILNSYQFDIDEKQGRINYLTNTIRQKLNDKQISLNEELEAYSNAHEPLINERAEMVAELNSLNKQLKDITNIKTVCPTCGRPYDNVHRPNTEPITTQIDRLSKSKDLINTRISEVENSHKKYLSDIESEYSTNELNESLTKTQSDLLMAQQHKNKFTDEINIKIKRYNELSSTISSIQQTTKILNEDLTNYKKDILTTSEKITQNNGDNLTMQKHIEVVNKMSTLVKRDFRGYLISDIITFLNKKSKEYCLEAFGTEDLEIYLDGNNLSIEYNSKPFESLSGGEKQKVDLILQLALREVMVRYMGFSSNLLCLDEIFDNLDSKSTHCVINMINDKLHDVESLFIISHHADELSIPYDCQLKIVKDENGISEVIY